LRQDRSNERQEYRNKAFVKLTSILQGMVKPLGLLRRRESLTARLGEAGLEATPSRLAQAAKRETAAAFEPLLDRISYRRFAGRSP
jgi:hypothetical protein